MTDPKDLIGIVKDLQARHDRCHYNYTGTLAFGRYLEELHNHFPAIAEALLIAVDAMNEHSREDCKRPGTASNCPIVKALSCIRRP